MGTELPAEMKFVTNAVRPEPDVARIEKLVARSLDWEQVVRRATERHKVGPLLYRRLVESGSDELIPDRVIERLRQHSRQVTSRNLSLTNTLLSILRHFDEETIPALPYKGPALSEVLYDDFSVRQSRDLDILVPPEHFHDAEDVLFERGFEPEGELTAKERRLLVKYGQHRTMRRDGTIVELHPRVSRPDPPFEVTGMLERAHSVDLAGDATPVIHPVDNLLALSVHGTDHRWTQLKWICDIAYLIQTERFDWPAVLEESRRRGCYRRVLLGCGLAATVLDVELPEPVHSEVLSVAADLLKDTYPDCLLGTYDVASLRYRLRGRDSTTDRIRYCCDELTVPNVSETVGVPVPERFFKLYYFYYPIVAINSKLTAGARTLASKVRGDTN